MGDQFEKFIMENKGSFDSEGPSDGLWDKIENDLKSTDTSSRRKNPFQLVWKVAAVLFLISTVYLLVDRNSNQTFETVLSQEFVEAEDYYITMISQRKNQIREQLTPEQETQFLSDINQLDSMYTELKKTYQTNASSERVMDAMISNLQLRLEILNRQLEILENIKNQNDETDNTIEI